MCLVLQLTPTQANGEELQYQTWPKNRSAAKIEGSTSQVCTVVCADLRNH